MSTTAALSAFSCMPRSRFPLRLSVPLPRDLCELAQASERVPDVEQEPEPVRAHGAVIGEHEHVFEECVQQRPELCGRLDGGAEVAGVQRGGDLRVDALERLRDL